MKQSELPDLSIFEALLASIERHPFASLVLLGAAFAWSIAHKDKKD